MECREVGGLQAGELEGRLPDRHVAAVDHDDRGIGEDADEGEADARVGAVRPEGQQEQPERARQERQPKQLGRREAGIEEGLGPEPDEDRREEQPDAVQPDVGEVGDVAARDQAEDESERDAADQHGRWWASCTPASCVTGMRSVAPGPVGAPRRGRSLDEVRLGRAERRPQWRAGQTRSAGGVAVASTRGAAMRSAACEISGI